MCISLNRYLDEWNPLTVPTDWLGNFLESHPTVYKITLIINHLFRAAMMVGLMFIPHVPLAASIPICLVGSLFYRLTVEKNCAYKFAIPAFAGAAAVMLALPAIMSIIEGSAFTTVATGFKNVASFIPFSIYAGYIILTVNYDVDKALARFESQETDSSLIVPPLETQNQCHCHSLENNQKI